MEKNELRKKVEMEIHHHIAPLIGWLRSDASKGVIDTVGIRHGQWKERADLAVDAIMGHVGEVEYEYAVQIITGPRAGELVPLWSDRKDRQDFIDDLYEFTGTQDYKLVKRRKAGPVQDA